MSGISRLPRVVAEAFYGRFTNSYPHQDEAAAALLDRKNIVLTAGTGSGKTEAAIAPLVSLYFDVMMETDSTSILYIVPTKALVNDIEKRLRPPLDNIGIRLGIRHGDRDDLKRAQRPHILVTTPESLDVLMFRQDKALHHIHAVVIDEAHQFYNTQRGLQLSLLLHRLEKHIQRELQFACLSATMGRPEHVLRFLFGAARPAVSVTGILSRPIDSHVRILETADEFVAAVRKLLGPGDAKLLIFANTRRECERLAQNLQQHEVLRDGIFTHYSSLSADIRQNVERSFSEAPAAVCVATGTLELGIDIGDVDAVILYGAPSSLESFLQRIGRSNRRSRKTNVVCLVPETSELPAFEALCFLCMLRLARTGEMSIRTPYELSGAAAQQCLSLVASRNGAYTRVAEFAEISDHLEHLPRSTVERILAELASRHFLTAHGFKNQYGGADNLYRLVDYRLIYGNFPASSQEVELNHAGLSLGTIPVSNLLRLEVGDAIRFAGQEWEISKLSPEQISVIPSRGRLPIKDVVYAGAGRTTDPFILNNVWRCIHDPACEIGGSDKRTQVRLEHLIHSIRSTCSEVEIPFFRDAAGFCYVTFAGKMVNTALALLLSPESFGATDLTLTVPHSIDWSLVPSQSHSFDSILPHLFAHMEVESQRSIYQEMLPESLAVREFAQSWYGDHSVNSLLERLSGGEPKLVERDSVSFLLA